MNTSIYTEVTNGERAADSRDAAAHGPRWIWWLGGAAVSWSVVAIVAMALYAGFEAAPGGDRPDQGADERPNKEPAEETPFRSKPEQAQ